MATRGLTQLAFEYPEMPASDVKALEKHAEAVLTIQERQRRLTAESVMKLGKELKSAHERLSNHGNGTFGKWCKERCGITHQHALRCIAIESCFGSKGFEPLVQNFDASALRLLSSDCCPEEAMSDAIKAAKKGEVITHKRAKEIIGNHVVDPEPDDEDDQPFGDSGLLAFTEIEERIREIAKADPSIVVCSLSRLRAEIIQEYGLDKD